MSKEILYATQFCIITFDSTQHALRAEKFLEKEGIADFLIIPTPREISSSCGLAIKFFCHEAELIKKKISDQGIAYDAVFGFKRNNDNTTTVNKVP